MTKLLLSNLNQEQNIKVFKRIKENLAPGKVKLNSVWNPVKDYQGCKEARK